jgi:hypothetical protein
VWCFHYWLLEKYNSIGIKNGWASATWQFSTTTKTDKKKENFISVKFEKKLLDFPLKNVSFEHNRTTQIAREHY